MDVDTEGGRRQACDASSGPGIEQTVGPGSDLIVQELCESRGGRPGLTSLMVYLDVKQY